MEKEKTCRLEICTTSKVEKIRIQTNYKLELRRLILKKRRLIIEKQKLRIISI